MDTSVEYLGLHIDERLTWATHIKNKRKSKEKLLGNCQAICMLAMA